MNWKKRSLCQDKGWESFVVILPRIIKQSTSASTMAALTLFINKDMQLCPRRAQVRWMHCAISSTNYEIMYWCWVFFLHFCSLEQDTTYKIYFLNWTLLYFSIRIQGQFVCLHSGPVVSRAAWLIIHPTVDGDSINFSPYIGRQMRVKGKSRLGYVGVRMRVIDGLRWGRCEGCRGHCAALGDNLVLDTRDEG